MSRLAVSLALAGSVATGGCYAPQTSGAARVTYISFATTSGAGAGMVGGLAACAVTGLNVGRDWVLPVCALAGLVAGGTGALVGSLRADEEPGAGAWLVMSFTPAWLIVLAAASVVKAVKK